ncbi:hypothetical protein J0675_26870, partial [Vibrio parahaemolyticus]
MLSSSSSKFKENEDKPGDACVAESGVGVSDIKKILLITNANKFDKSSINNHKKHSQYHHLKHHLDVYSHIV